MLSLHINAKALVTRNAKEGEDPTILLLCEIRFRNTQIFSLEYF